LKANFIEPGVDIASEMEFDGEAFVQEYISEFHDVTPLELYHQKLRGYLEENHPDLGHGDIIRTKRIAVGKLPFIPASLVIRPRKFHGEFAEIPENKRYKVRFIIYNDSSMFIDHTTSLPEILGKSVTISFAPETEADLAVIEEFGGVYQSPAHLLRLKPILKVEHQTVAEGEGGVGLGVRNNFDMHFIAPHPTQ
ncbi:MAG: hypothetical protein GY859_13975, partial [Desulfobacterales bacterium]|nr:hypothetical protein [Desulfobacterales bacterium]